MFWGYVMPPKLPSLVTAMLDKGQLGLIFDLDETLLVAHTLSSIESRIESCRKAKWVCAVTLSFVKWRVAWGGRDRGQGCTERHAERRVNAYAKRRQEGAKALLAGTDAASIAGAFPRVRGVCWLRAGMGNFC